MIWPSDADGEVLRRLSEAGLDFSKVAWIDFNVDFDTWPPIPIALDEIANAFPDARVSLEDGYVLVRLERLISYDLVTSVQAKLSEATAEFGGSCDTWGVLVRPGA
jgi:hypothetical protein